MLESLTFFPSWLLPSFLFKSRKDNQRIRKYQSDPSRHNLGKLEWSLFLWELPQCDSRSTQTDGWGWYN